jgi:hypothetical protein
MTFENQPLYYEIADILWRTTQFPKNDQTPLEISLFVGHGSMRGVLI